MDKITACDAVANFERWHAKEMSRIGARGQVLRGLILGMGVLILATLAAAWFV